MVTASSVIRIRVQGHMTAPCVKTLLLPVILQAVKVRDLLFMAVRVQTYNISTPMTVQTMAKPGRVVHVLITQKMRQAVQAPGFRIRPYGTDCDL